VVCVTMFLCGFCTLDHLGFTPRASLYFTVNLIVSTSLCSILIHNLITNRKEFVVELKLYLLLLVLCKLAHINLLLLCKYY
jgi:hypothetical protein